jgi:hypothetical protein
LATYPKPGQDNLPIIDRHGKEVWKIPHRNIIIIMTGILSAVNAESFIIIMTIFLSAVNVES